MRAIAEDVLPASGGYRVRYSGEAEKFFESGNALIFAYLLAILVVYLVLAAQFESFLHPATILVAVFLSFTGALIALAITDVTLNLFSKIGIVMLVGLVTKNSILLVDYTNQLRKSGLDKVEAVKRAAPVRMRPVLMTATSMIFGVLPAAVGFGPGAESRAPMAIATAAGMFTSTLLTLLLVPLFYLIFDDLAEAGRRGLRRIFGRGPAAAIPAAMSRQSG